MNLVRWPGVILVVSLVIGISPAARAGTATLDSSFGNGGIVTTDVNGNGQVNALAVLPDKRIVAAGTDNNVAILARYTEGGVLDPFMQAITVDGTVRGLQGSADAGPTRRRSCRRDAP